MLSRFSPLKKPILAPKPEVLTTREQSLRLRQDAHNRRSRCEDSKGLPVSASFFVSC